MTRDVKPGGSGGLSRLKGQTEGWTGETGSLDLNSSLDAAASGHRPTKSRLELYDHALRGGLLDDAFRLIRKEFAKRLSDARQQSVVVREHDPTGNHARVEVFQ